MLPATEQEIEGVMEYMRSEAPDLTVTFVQKVYAENVLHVRHDVWDVHTNVDRWWVITQPTNLYAQEQFPNMDLALTFHIGLCLRIPRSERQQLSELTVEPFAECFRNLREASDALAHAGEVSDYQAIGVRCREALLAFTNAAQIVMPWTSSEQAPKQADLKAWADHICSVALVGASQEHRRHLFKALLEDAWKFTNWLTHARSSNWYDAEAAIATSENAVGLCTSAVIRYIRGVPEHCPACGSERLVPERGYHDDFPDVEWEQPTCPKCGWRGKPVAVDDVAEPLDHSPTPPPDDAHSIPKIPLRQLSRPKRRDQ
jgi:hypothetical protein